jgi:hypothetical protein
MQEVRHENAHDLADPLHLHVDPLTLGRGKRVSGRSAGEVPADLREPRRARELKPRRAAC